MFPHGDVALDILRRKKVEACIYLKPLVPNIVPGTDTSYWRGCLFAVFAVPATITWTSGVAWHQQDFPWLFIKRCEYK
jgi:hypothetical protein